MIVIGLLGKDGGKLLKLCHESIVVPSEDYGIVENIHLNICHMVAKGVNE